MFSTTSKILRVCETLYEKKHSNFVFFFIFGGEAVATCARSDRPGKQAQVLTLTVLEGLDSFTTRHSLHNIYLMFEFNVLKRRVLTFP